MVYRNWSGENLIPNRQCGLPLLQWMANRGVDTMITSSNGSIFLVTGPLCGEFTCHRWIPHTKASDGQLWCSLNLRMNKRLSKQSWGWWSETPSCSLWRQCNDVGDFCNMLWITHIPYDASDATLKNTLCEYIIIFVTNVFNNRLDILNKTILNKAYLPRRTLFEVYVFQNVSAVTA